MLKREVREQRISEWLDHLQRWKQSGQSLSAYARAEGLALWSVYHWREVLRREGCWQESPTQRRGSSALARGKRSVPLRFARVRVSDTALGVGLTIRVQLLNGRRAEIDLGESGQLVAMLALLEQPA
jgi:hypothetical protein